MRPAPPGLEGPRPPGRPSWCPYDPRCAWSSVVAEPGRPAPFRPAALRPPHQHPPLRRRARTVMRAWCLALGASDRHLSRSGAHHDDRRDCRSVCSPGPSGLPPATPVPPSATRYPAHTRSRVTGRREGPRLPRSSAEQAVSQQFEGRRPQRVRRAASPWSSAVLTDAAICGEQLQEAACIRPIACASLLTRAVNFCRPGSLSWSSAPLQS